MGARRLSRMLVPMAALSLLPTLATAAQAEPNPGIVIQNGVTAPVFGYADAIRERVFVDTDMDTDKNGVKDVAAFDIIRPKATADGLKVPVIMDASPYYRTSCRGNETECKLDTDGDGLLDQWPLFYDNYFVPRGYAVVLSDALGTANSTGCPTTGGKGDTAAALATIDWLNGRRTGRHADGSVATAGWHNGKTGMIGKSYDGTIANAAAATGIEGLTTIVPISAISSWYDYQRTGGVRHSTGYASYLSNAVTGDRYLPEVDRARKAACAAIRTELDAGAGDDTGDYSAYWAERDYRPDADQVKASVFVYHGINDHNVRGSQFSEWWYELAENDVTRKIWISQLGHVDPFDIRRGDWVNTLHRWFDHELQGVENGILDEPMADIEQTPLNWVTATNWPQPGTVKTNVYLQPNSATTPGGLALHRSKSGVSETYTDTRTSETVLTRSLPTEVNSARLVYMTAPLTADLHISGTPELSLRFKTDRNDASLSTFLVDLGTGQHISTTNDGALTGTEEDCWGESSAADNACYKKVTERVITNEQELVTRGIQDASNINSLSRDRKLTPNQYRKAEIKLQPEDYVFAKGHRIAIVVAGSNSSWGQRTATESNGAVITLDPRDNRIELPIVGGAAAAKAAGIAK
ncbi:CocE/NonD family hydrolase [Motilibacter deserti]|uniref:CocE/NonD family hydrolase n=1 Tax=Motilibacter deserti TaxID=2714956 RepID=A0ABX0GYD8_9ACTN|nr:CocE/NonD family hydrolase [Motilibacter deserti]NHC15973.1 CocE/NonD family hydrolase [Motilibacter deserti]